MRGAGELLARAWNALRAALGRPGPGTPAKALGARGERAAAAYLGSRGYRVLARNAVVPMGEADLVCEDADGRTIVIVEVKTRRRGVNARSDTVPPEAAITARKRRKLRSIAAYLARANGWEDRPMRIDAVAVEVPREGEPRVRHTRRIA